MPRSSRRGAPIAQAVVLARYGEIHLALGSPAGLDSWAMARRFRCDERSVHRYLERITRWGIRLTRDLAGRWRYDGRTRRLFDLAGAAASVA